MKIVFWKDRGKKIIDPSLIYTDNTDSILAQIVSAFREKNLVAPFLKSPQWGGKYTVYTETSKIRTKGVSIALVPLSLVNMAQMFSWIDMNELSERKNNSVLEVLKVEI